jgi:hypothetical protein
MGDCSLRSRWQGGRVSGNVPPATLPPCDPATLVSPRTVDFESHIVKRAIARYNKCEAGTEGPAV